MISNGACISEGPREVCEEEKDGCPSRSAVLLDRDSVTSRIHRGIKFVSATAGLGALGLLNFLDEM